MSLVKPEGISVNLIAAIDRNGAIGVGDKLPWHHPLEMKYFRTVTMNGAVLMGAATYRSFGNKPLKQRRNIVLTRTPEQFNPHPDLVVITDPNQAFEHTAHDELLVIGGAQIYAMFLPIADGIFLTEMDLEVPEADVFFPEFDRELYHLPARYPNPAQELDGKTLPAWTPTVYQRRLDL